MLIKKKLFHALIQIHQSVTIFFLYYTVFIFKFKINFYKKNCIHPHYEKNI